MVDGRNGDAGVTVSMVFAREKDHAAIRNMIISQNLFTIFIAVDGGWCKWGCWRDCVNGV